MRWVPHTPTPIPACLIGLGLRDGHRKPGPLLFQTACDDIVDSNRDRAAGRRLPELGEGATADVSRPSDFRLANSDLIARSKSSQRSSIHRSRGLERSARLASPTLAPGCCRSAPGVFFMRVQRKSPRQSPGRSQMLFGKRESEPLTVRNESDSISLGS